MDCDIFIWNCQGANGSKFVRTMLCFLDKYKPKILVLLEPRISGFKADRVIKNLVLIVLIVLKPRVFLEGYGFFGEK